MVVWAKHWTELKYKALFQNVRGAHDSQEHVFHSNAFDSNPYLVGIVKLLQVQELHHTRPFFFLGQYPVLRLAPETYQCCVFEYINLSGAPFPPLRKRQASLIFQDLNMNLCLLFTLNAEMSLSGILISQWPPQQSPFQHKSFPEGTTGAYLASIWLYGVIHLDSQ